MTKHVSPEITGTELSTADYTRPYDGATMRWDGKLAGGIGSFNAVPGSFEVKRDTKRDNSAKDTGSVIGDMESFHDTKESPKSIGLKFMQSNLEKLFDKEKSEEQAEADSEKDSLDKDGKRRVKNGPRCNLTPSKKRPAYVRPVFVVSPRDASEPYYIDTFSLWVGSEVIDFTFKPLPVGRPISHWRVNDAAADDGLCLRMAPQLALDIEIIEASKSRARQVQYGIDHPENDSEIFPRKPRNASPTHEKDAGLLNALMEYRRLNESLEPLQTSYGKADGEKYVKGVDSGAGDGEGEDEEQDDVAVPRTDAELENRPSVEEMEARWNVPTVKYETCKYGIKIPVSGDIECTGYWSIRRIGGLRFDYRGRLTRYVNKKNPNRWHSVKKDIAGTPRGPEFLGSADQNNEDEMKRKGWAPLHPLTRKTRKWPLSGAEESEQSANEDVPESQKCRELYHRSRRGPRRHPMPYDTAAEMPGRAHAFGSKYTKPEEPADDVVERRSYLEAVKSMLTPQARRVVNMVVLTDLTDELAPTYEALGAILDCKKASQSTLIRLGKRAIEQTAAELSVIYQELAA